MSDLLGISSAAVGVYQRSLSVISNNIANAATEGYSRQDVSLQVSPNRALGNIYMGTGVVFDAVKRQYDSFAESNLRNSNSDLESQSPMVSYTNRVIDVMSGQNLGLSSAIDQFFASTRQLAADPASTVLRGSFLRDADSLADRFGQLSAQLDLVDSETRESVASNVNQMNALTSQLAKVNVQLSKSMSLTRQPPELLDQRDTLLRDLSKFARLNTRFTDNGMVTVSLGASMTQEVVVDGRQSWSLGVDFNAASAEKFSLVLDPYGDAKPLTGINSGAMAGLMAFREQVLGSTRSALDVLANNLVTQVNQIHQSGVDGYGQTGMALFAIDPAAAHASEGIKVTTKDPLKIAAGAAFRVVENPNNTGEADAAILYSTPSFAGAAKLNEVLVNNPHPSSGANLSLSANPGMMAIASVPAGMKDVTFYLDTLSSGQQVQILTRDGRHVLGQKLNEDQQDRILTPANGMEAGATYSDVDLNIKDGTGYLGLKVFYGAKAEPLAEQMFDATGTAIAPVMRPAVLMGNHITPNWSGLPAGDHLQLNGIKLGPLTPANAESGVSAQEVAAWMNAAGVNGVRAVAETELRIPANKIQLSASLAINGIPLTSSEIEPPATGFASAKDLVAAINQEKDNTRVEATLGAKGEIILRPTTGHEGASIQIGATVSSLTPNALGIAGGYYSGNVKLERTDGSLKPIEVSLGADGSAADLNRLGLRAGAYLSGDVPDDLLVFVTGEGAATLSTSYSGAADVGTERLRNNPMTVAFTSPTHYTITDVNTGTVLAERDYEPNDPQAVIGFRGLQLRLSNLPQTGDTFVMDGNKDGTGNNENLLNLLALESAPVMGGGKTLSAAYIDHVNNMGNIARQAGIVQSALIVVHDQAVSARSQVSGVSLDEEAANLIRFQQAYQASAKVMQVASQLFDTVLQVR